LTKLPISGGFCLFTQKIIDPTKKKLKGCIYTREELFRQPFTWKLLWQPYIFKEKWLLTRKQKQQRES